MGADILQGAAVTLLRLAAPHENSPLGVKSCRQDDRNLLADAPGEAARRQCLRQQPPAGLVEGSGCFGKPASFICNKCEDFSLRGLGERDLHLRKLPLLPKLSIDAPDATR